MISLHDPEAERRYFTSMWLWYLLINFRLNFYRKLKNISLTSKQKLVTFVSKVY